MLANAITLSQSLGVGASESDWQFGPAPQWAGSELTWGDDPGLAANIPDAAWARASTGSNKPGGIAATQQGSGTGDIDATRPGSGTGGPGGINATQPGSGTGGPGGTVAMQHGRQFNVTLNADGTVSTWGVNNLGQLGDGTTEDQPNPVPVVGLADIVAIASGEAHTLALGRDGSVWAWGSNARGQLGTTTTDVCDMGSPCSRTPVHAAGVERAVGIAAGGNYSLALVPNDR